MKKNLCVCENLLLVSINLIQNIQIYELNKLTKEKISAAVGWF